MKFVFGARFTSAIFSAALLIAFGCFVGCGIEVESQAVKIEPSNSMEPADINTSEETTSDETTSDETTSDETTSEDSDPKVATEAVTFFVDGMV